MTITTNWQTVGTYRFEYSGFICEFYIDAKYSNQSRENNTTTMQCRLRSKVIRGQGSGYGYYFRLDYAGPVEGSGLWTVKDEVISSAETIITHNDDGTKSTGVTADIRINGLGLNTSFSGTFDLPPISRYAIITNAINFTDEENPTITFTNSGLYGLRAKLLVGNTEIYSEDLQGNETSYTYNLTTNQRNQLRELCTDKLMEVVVSICSINNNEIVYTSSKTILMSIVNAEPTYTYTAQETNTKVISFLNSSAGTSLINNVSNVQFTVLPTTYKYATVSSVSVYKTGYSDTKTASPYVLNLPIEKTNLTSSSLQQLYLEVVDSRGFSKYDEERTRTVYPYELLKINSYSFKRQSQISSNIVLNLNVVYFDTIAGIQNTPVVKWKLNDGSYNTIPSSYYVIDTTNNTLKITNYELTNVLSYQSTGQFTIYIEDALTTVQDSGINGHVLKGVATFDVGEHDLQVNGDLYIADTNRENAVNVLDELNNLPKSYNLVTGGSEVKVGYKVDNKDVYAKRLNLPNLGTNVTVNHGLSNFTLIDVDVVTYYQGTYRKMNYTTNYWVDVGTTAVYYYGAYSLSGGTGKITLYYTKN